MSPRRVQRPIRPAIAPVLAVIVFLHATGCSSTLPRAGDASGSNPGRATEATPPGDSSASAVILTVAPDTGLPASSRTRPGIRRFAIEAKWSNGAVHKQPFVLDVEADRSYLLLAYERGFGPAAVTAEAVDTFSARPAWCDFDSLAPAGGGGAGGPGAGALFVVIGIWHGLCYMAYADPAAKPKPSEDCCFIWVEDAESGGHVGGTPPWGVLAFSRRVQSPPTAEQGSERDELVNCWVGGQRIWTYRSRCD